MPSEYTLGSLHLPLGMKTNRLVMPAWADRFPGFFGKAAEINGSSTTLPVAHAHRHAREPKAKSNSI